MLPASQTKQFLLKTNSMCSNFLLPKATNDCLLFIPNSVNLSVARFLYILYSFLKLFAETRDTGCLPCYIKWVLLSSLFRGIHKCHQRIPLGWPGLTAASSLPSLLAGFCSSLNLRLPLCYTDFPELFKKRSFWITRLYLNPPLFWHLSSAEFLGSASEEASTSKQKRLPRLVEFKMKATNTTKPCRIWLF